MQLYIRHNKEISKFISYCMNTFLLKGRVTNFCKESSRKLSTKPSFNDKSTMTSAYFMTNTQLGYQTVIYMAELGLTRLISYYRKRVVNIAVIRSTSDMEPKGLLTQTRNLIVRSLFLHLSYYTCTTSFERLCLILIISIFRTLIRCIKYIKRLINTLWFCRCNFIS